MNEEANKIIGNHTTEIITIDHKYEATIYDHGKIHVKRYGHAWRTFTGDKFVMCLLYEVAELRKNYQDLDRMTQRWGAELTELRGDTDEDDEKIVK